MKTVLAEINNKKFGVCIISGEGNRLEGIITDGDIRRNIIENPDFLSSSAADIIKGFPQCISPETLAAEALKILEQKQITSLIVTDEENKILGLLHLHDLWRTEMI